MKKRINSAFVIVILILMAQQNFCQQLGLYTNYLLNDFYYNPAIAGSKDVSLANLSYRSQWSGFNEAPKTYMASVYGSLKNKRKVGLGINVNGDRAGLTSKTAAYATYAYHFNLTEKIRLGLGVQAGFLQYSVRLYDARLADNGDDLLTGNVASAGTVDINSGAYLYHDKFWLGFSGYQLLQSKLHFQNSSSKLASHYYATGGVNIKLNKKNILQPSFLFRQGGPVPYQFDLSARWTYDKKFWVGFTYRTSDAYCILAGFNYKNLFNIGYSFDTPFSNMKKYSMGSHEIWLSYTITRKKKTLDEEDEEINNGVHELYKQQQKKQQENEPKE